MSFFEIVLQNLRGYDALIVFVFAPLAALVFYVAWNKAKKLERLLKRPTGTGETSKFDLLTLREESRASYALVERFAAIFPMLGILGTVFVLIPMAADMENLGEGFLGALTSTAWGVIFAIICKFFEAPLAARMDENFEEINRILLENKND